MMVDFGTMGEKGVLYLTKGKWPKLKKITMGISFIQIDDENIKNKKKLEQAFLQEGIKVSWFN